MYRSFKVKNFRGFKDLEIKNIQRVNLIAGLNNVGKTTLLEAIFLHCGASSLELANRLNILRGIETINLQQIADFSWTNLFFNFDTSKQIEIEGTDDKEQKRRLRLMITLQKTRLVKIDSATSEMGLSGHNKERSDLLSYDVLELEYQDEEKTERYQLMYDPLQNVLRIEPVPPPPLFPGYFLTARRGASLSEDAERFGNLEIKGQQDILLETLKIIEPRLNRLAVVTRAGTSIIHGDIGIGRLMPLPIMGEGMVRICSLILAIANAPNGVILIDEIENDIHHSVRDKLWKAIGYIARQFNTQIFATTHSYECIVAAHRAFSENSVYDFCLYRLEDVKGKIEVIAYDQEGLESTIESGWEVR
jgi:AAA15 family ATPase/GTPase